MSVFKRQVSTTSHGLLRLLCPGLSRGDELKFTSALNFLKRRKNKKKKKVMWQHVGKWEKAIRNSWVLITGFATGLISASAAQALKHEIQLNSSNTAWEFLLLNFSALPCQRGCNGPSESTTAEME